MSEARRRTRRGEVVGIHWGQGVEDRRAQITLRLCVWGREIRVRLRLRGLVLGWRQRQHRALGPRLRAIVVRLEGDGVLTRGARLMYPR